MLNKFKFVTILLILMFLSSSCTGEDFKLTLPTFSISGTVKLEDGTPVESVSIKLFSGNKKTILLRAFLTKSDGKYFFEEIADDGEFIINATRSGYRNYDKTLNLKGFSDVTEDITLQPEK